jgi:hypothetical protein
MCHPPLVVGGRFLPWSPGRELVNLSVSMKCAMALDHLLLVRRLTGHASHSGLDSLGAPPRRPAFHECFDRELGQTLGILR